MPRGIQLERSPITLETLPDRGEVFRITISVASAELMPSKVFLFKQLLIDPYTQLYAREFVCVVDPYEASLYPEDEPAEGVAPRYFRDDVLDLAYPQKASAEQIWVEIQQDVADLLAAYNRLDTLIAAETEVI